MTETMYNKMLGIHACHKIAMGMTYTQSSQTVANMAMINVLTTTPNRRVRSAVCLTVRGSHGSEQVSLVSGYNDSEDDSSEMGRRLSIT